MDSNYGNSKGETEISDFDKSVEYLTDIRNFMSRKDAEFILSNATEWPATKIRDKSNKEIINELKSQKIIMIGNHSILVPIDYQIKFKDDFQPTMAISFSQFGKKPQTMCHVAQNPAILEGRFGGKLKDIAYLIPIRFVFGTRLRKREVQSTNQIDNDLLSVVLENVIEIKSLIKGQ